MTTPSERNRLLSAATQSAMEARLGRKLTSAESDKIWNTGSFQGLEMIDMAIHYAQSIDALEAYLAGLPERDPLPERYTKRF